MHIEERTKENFLHCREIFHFFFNKLFIWNLVRYLIWIFCIVMSWVLSSMKIENIEEKFAIREKWIMFRKSERMNDDLCKDAGKYLMSLIGDSKIP